MSGERDNVSDLDYKWWELRPTLCGGSLVGLWIVAGLQGSISKGPMVDVERGVEVMLGALFGALAVDIGERFGLKGAGIVMLCAILAINLCPLLAPLLAWIVLLNL